MEIDQDTSKKVLVFIKENPGSKARKISSVLDLDKKEVNKLLYGPLKGQCRQDSAYNWYLKEDLKTEAITSIKQTVNTPLARLCNYYSSCIAEDTGAKVRVFAQSKYGLDYKELETIPSSEDTSEIFESSEVQNFLNESRKDKSQMLYFGYPVLMSHARSSKSDWEGYFVSPIFLFPIKVENDGVNLDLNFPTINREVLERYTDAKGEELMKELVTLEEELGISGEGEQPELDELIQRLKVLRPEWQWVEDPDPYNLVKDPPLRECTSEGIFNRAVVVKVQEAPNNFTQGLEYELSQLARLSENDYKDTALGQWIYRNIGDAGEKNLNSLLEVFPMNLEQREAVQNALVNDLTIITGPPGTGKSQVVTNLLINAAWQKKRVLFASKNNKAVDVVESRVNNIGTRPILLRLGGKGDYQDQLVSHLSNLLATTVDQQDEREFAERKQEFEDVHAELLNIDSQINDLVILRNKVDELDRDINDARNDLSEDIFALIKNKRFLSVKPEIEILLNKLEYALKPKISFFEKIGEFLFGSKISNDIIARTTELQGTLSELDISIPTQPLNKYSQQVWVVFKDELQHRWNQTERVRKYFYSLEELQKSDSLETLTKQRLNLLNRMSDKSSVLWKLWLKLQIGRLSHDDRSLLSQYRSTLQMASGSNPTQSVWRNYYSQSQKISHILSTWAVTSLSAKGRIPLSKNIFDLVVFDESSQCDIASALPLLYRAKQAVVIGDPKQLSHISSISKKQDERLLEKYGLLDTHSDWAYSYNSLFDLAAGLSRGTGIIDLRDHYRSHADIINFSNQFFYKGRLRIATRYDSLKRPKDENAGIRWINVEGRAEKAPLGSGSQNKQEAEVVVTELRRLFEQGYKGTIGVVSPFRAQANLIRKLINEDSELLGWLSTCEFISETVHKFQGDERDIIIFSPVISKGMPNGSTLFLQKTGNLFNVAITRARAMLIVIGDHEAVLHSDILYMEKFAQHVNEIGKQKEYKIIQSTSLGPEYPTVKNPELVSDWEHIFYKALYDAGICPIPQYQEEMYILDFAIFDGDKKLNIEIDGEHYHKDWTGELCYRDQMRNQRMYELGWDVMRFWVYEVRDDLDGCIKKINDWISPSNK
ncbi:MAG: AAA domain-containing protein [Candidatus Paceibacterota bacterium]|jgi:superfamily I DNA and/or RNA helicase/very-short-patch-repair endonuclease